MSHASGAVESVAGSSSGVTGTCFRVSCIAYLFSYYQQKVAVSELSQARVSWFFEAMSFSEPASRCHPSTIAVLDVQVSIVLVRLTHRGVMTPVSRNLSRRYVYISHISIPLTALQASSPKACGASRTLLYGALCSTLTHRARSNKNDRLVMHETIGQLSSRISLLEAAIEQMQSLVSTEPHPLLQGRDVQAMHPVVSTQPRKPPTTPEEDVVKALGAFSIGDKGETTFHEASATSEASLLPCIC
jgi:hypothetical protein